MKEKTVLALTIVLSLLFLMTGPATAQDRETVIDSMKERYAALQEAKDQGLVGEAWTGLVGLVDDNAPAQVKALVDGENSDRRTLFQIIAKDTGTSLGEVARQNRIRMYRLADDSHFVQNEKREWVRKGSL